jgi:hypothetical protein
LVLELREVVTYPPGKHEFRPGNYPWLAAVRVGVQGAQGGASSDGNPGAASFDFREIPRAELPEVVPVEVGRGGRSGLVTDLSTGVTCVSEQGHDGLVVVELYAESGVSETPAP